MLENFIYSINVILPIFILVVIGWLFKRTGFLNDAFFSMADKLVFKVMLPCMIFLEIAGIEIEGGADRGKLIAFACISMTAAFVLASLIIPIFVKDNEKRGAMIQSSFRSNFAILGVPLADSMFGDEGAMVIAILMPFVILMYNGYSVIAFTLFAPKSESKSFTKVFLGILKSAITNPLIIAVLLALPFMIFKIELPTFATKTLGYFSNATVSISLLSLGAGITAGSFRAKAKYSVSVSLIKTVILPTVMITVAYALGFRGAELGCMFVMFGTPAAVSSYIMAKNMHSDCELAGQILLLTTLFCLFTIFLGIFVMKSIGWL